MNGPETIVTADITKHLVVSAENPKERVVEENIFQSPGVFHPTQVDTRQVVLPWRLYLLNSLSALLEADTIATDSLRNALLTSRVQSTLFVSYLTFNPISQNLKPFHHR